MTDRANNSPRRFLARYGARVETILACATKGENYAREGFSPSVREDELRKAAQALRIDRVHFLGFHNGEMIQMLGPINGRIVRNEREIPVNAAWFGGLKSGQRWEDHVEAVRILGELAFRYPPDIEGYDWRNGRLSRLVEVVVRLIRTERPAVIVTMEPFGNYGHNEHIIIHHAATVGFYLSGRENVWPAHRDEGLTPHAPKKLYWGGLYDDAPHQSEERKAAIAEARQEMGVPAYRASLVVTYPEVAEQVYTALSAHRSQFDLPSWSALDEPMRPMRRFLASDCVLRVHPPVQEGESPETSIADGTLLLD
jgi:LmbE family N-acetylglucosaminyl deacetylase